MQDVFGERGRVLAVLVLRVVGVFSLVVKADVSGAFGAWTGLAASAGQVDSASWPQF